MKTRIYLTLLFLLLIAPAAISSQASAKAAEEPDIFCRLILSTEKTYVGEAFVASLMIYTTHNIDRIDVENGLKHKEFEAMELKINNVQTSYQRVDGKQYLAGVLRRWILTPLKKGKHKIEIDEVKAVVEVPQLVDYGFYSAYKYQAIEVDLRATSVEIQVESLPGKKPSDFSGAVGLFETDLQMSKRTLIVGEEATLTYSISGIGNPGLIAKPTISLPPGITIKDSKHSTDVHLTGKNIVGSYTATYRVVPTKAGRYSVELPEFIYFDPASAKYATIPSRKVDIPVAYGEVFEM
ncbi:MAG: BatD family protein [Paramuribaculum sp.]|nr:BatD family protein [Paramuribaculum sp.]